MYRLEAGPVNRVFNLELNSADLGQMVVTLYQGACGTLRALDCNQGKERSVNLRNVTIESNSTYFIAVSSLEGATGTFDLCYSYAADENQCNKQPTLTVMSTSLGSPLSGPYVSGEEVEFCYTVFGFENASCNYLQGILPFFGPGWSEDSFNADGSPKNITQPLLTQGRTSFTTSNPVCEGDPAGVWNWYEAGVISYNLNSTNPMGYRFGDDVDAGWVFLNSFDPTCFEFDDACCTNPTSDPNQSYGDDNYPVCGGGLSHEWTVCISLTTRITTTPSPDNDCMVGFKTFADGELGAFRSNSCSRDRVTYLNAAKGFAPQPTFSAATAAVSELELCPQETFTLDIEVDDPEARLYWFDGQGKLFVAEPGTKSITLTAPLTGKETYEIYATSGNASEPLLIDVSAKTEIDAVIEQSPEQVCDGEPVTLTAVMADGTSLSSATIAWSDGSDSETLMLTDWVETYTVDLSEAGCSTTLTHQINSFRPSQVTLEGSDIICQGDEAVLELNLTGISPWTIVLGTPAGETTLVLDEATFTEAYTPDSNLNFTVVTATDGNGCAVEVDGQFEVVVNADPQVQADTEVTLFCNEGVELQATAIDPTIDYLFEWFDQGGTELGTGQLIEVDETGVYTLITTDNSTGCQVTNEVEVLDSPEETLEIEIVNGTSIDLSQGLEVQLEVLTNLELDEVNTVTWTGPVGLDCYDCLTPFASPMTDATYIVEVADIYGCIAQLTVDITITDIVTETENSRSLYIPTAFQPGSDNDGSFCVFDDGQSGAVISLEIFDRWGSKVFAAMDASLGAPTACWDGTKGGQILEQGVYVYKASVTYPGEKESILSGSLTLVR